MITPQDYQRDEHLLPLSLSLCYNQSTGHYHSSTTAQLTMCQLTTQANEFLIRHFLRHRGKLDTLQLSIKVKHDCLIPETFHYKNKKNKLLPKLEMLKIRTKSQLLVFFFLVLEIIEFGIIESMSDGCHYSQSFLMSMDHSHLRCSFLSSSVNREWTA